MFPSIASIICELTLRRHQWNPRIKAATLYKFGKEFRLSQLSGEEIERLIQLVDVNAAVKRLIEPQFNGFSRTEKRRRLSDRCEADTFVCLRSIFASENFDDIILREYADLAPNLQDIFVTLQRWRTLASKCTGNC